MKKTRDTLVMTFREGSGNAVKSVNIPISNAFSDGSESDTSVKIFEPEDHAKYHRYKTRMFHICRFAEIPIDIR